MKKRISAVAGLQTAPNVIDAPPGSFLELKNCVVRTAGVIESRRGQGLLAYPFDAPAAAPQGQVVGADTLALWKFDEASGSLVDSATGAYTLPSYGSASASVAGVINGARNFGGYPSGNQSFLLLAGPTGGGLQFSNGDWTILGWVNRNGFTVGGNLFTCVGASGVLGTGLSGTGTFQAYGVGTGATAPTPLSLNGWHLCGLRYVHSTQVCDVWIDTAVVQHNTGFAAPTIGATPAYAFGRYADTVNTDLFAGWADDWAVYTRALTDAEILDIRAKALGYTPSITGGPLELSFFSGSVLAHLDSNQLIRDTGSAFTAYNGLYPAPAPDSLRMKFARAQQRLYFTSSSGIKRLDSTASQPVAAGVPAPQIDANSSHLRADAIGFLGEDESVGYRPTLTHRDPLRRELESAPGARFVVRSQKDLTSPIGGVVASSGTITVTFNNPHNLKPGDIIDTATALVGFLYPLTVTVATVPTSYSVTGAYASADATSVATSDWDMAGNMSVARRRVDLKILLPTEAVLGDILRLYRTEATPYDVTSSPAAPIDPGDEVYVCYEKTLTSTDITNKYVNFSDYTPDVMLGDSGYFSPSQETIAAENDRPPLARDITTFDSRLWFANVVQRQQLNFTVLATGGSQGITTGDTLTISMGAKTITLTASITGNVDDGDGHYLVALGGNVSGDNEKTALSLVASINAMSTNDFVDAFYLSDATTNPGAVLLQERGVGAADPLSVVVSAHGSGFTPQLPTTGGKTSKSSAFPNRVYRAKPELPDAVPILNGYEVVGEVDDAVLRIVAAGGLLWVFKERSTWNISPAGDGTYTVTEFSPDLRLVGNDTPAVLGTTLYCLTNLGPVALSAAGVTPIGLPIDDLITSLSGYDATNFPMLPTLRRYSFGVSYATDRMWLLCLPSSPSDTYANLIYAWNAGTGVWSGPWVMSRQCGVVEPSTDLLYMGGVTISTSTLFKERKQYRREDFKDELLETLTVDVVTSNADGTVTMHYAGAGSLPPLGSLVEQTGIYSPNKLKGVVKAVDIVAGTFTLFPTTLLAGDSWQARATRIYKPIAVALRWLDEDCGVPGMFKTLQGVNLHFQRGAFYQGSLKLSTELTSELELKPIAGPSGYNVTTYSGGGTPYDHFAPPEKDTSLAAYYRFSLELTESEFYFKFAGMTLDFTPCTERTGRR